MADKQQSSSADSATRSKIDYLSEALNHSSYANEPKGFGNQQQRAPPDSPVTAFSALLRRSFCSRCTASFPRAT